MNQQKQAALVGSLMALSTRVNVRQGCRCRKCRHCQNHARWDRMFAGFAARQVREFQGMGQLAPPARYTA